MLEAGARAQQQRGLGVRSAGWRRPGRETDTGVTKGLHDPPEDKEEPVLLPRKPWRRRRGRIERGQAVSAESTRACQCTRLATRGRPRPLCSPFLPRWNMELLLPRGRKTAGKDVSFLVKLFARTFSDFMFLPHPEKLGSVHGPCMCIHRH